MHGLLEHDFGDSDLVGRIAHMPRKLAAVGAKPREEALPQLAEVICRIDGFFFAWHLVSSRNGNPYLELFRSLISATCKIISSGSILQRFSLFENYIFCSCSIDAKGIGTELPFATIIRLVLPVLSGSALIATN